MIEIQEVTSRKQRRQFVEFPLNLYKGNPYFVPPLYMDEMKMFRKDFVYLDTCEHVFYVAYKDGCVAGRISGILQKAHNIKTGEKRVRFTRFDVIEDFEVAKALFEAVENWARSKDMDIVFGPLNYSDLEREGLLIEGFDQLSTFEEQYNAPYYADFIERLGYRKEVEWLESKIYAPDEDDESLDKLANFVLKRYKLHIGKSRNASDFLKKYADGWFDILDKSYQNVYGTVPFTEGMKKLLMANFKLIIDTRFVIVILDENEKAVLMGICFPSLAKAVQKSGGRLTPGCLYRILKAVRKPEVIDFGLIGVDPAWANRGVSVAVTAAIIRMLRQPGVKYAETNLNLEDNYDILNMWKHFNAVQHKRRRAYIKNL